MAAKENSKEMLDVLSVLDHIAALPDDVALDTGEAALYLRLSRSTLERMRVDGSGPEYVQGPAIRRGTNRRGTNQKITYILGDLRAWRDRHKVSSSMSAAIRNGMALVCLKDAASKLPFWTLDGFIYGRVLDDSPGEYLWRRDAFEMSWLSSAEAVFKAWKEPEKQERLVADYQRVLRQELNDTERLLLK
jgi:hypothetical protein